jgi:hypothetical protein
MQTLDELIAEEEADDAAGVNGPGMATDTSTSTSTSAEPPAPAPSVAPPEPAAASDRRATTATTPAEARKGNKVEQWKKFASDEAAQSAEALGMGAARGVTLGQVDRLVGEGTQLGEDWYNLAHGRELTGGIPESEKARAEWLAREDAARKAAPVSSLVGETVGSFVPTMATSGALNPMAGRTMAAASGVESSMPAARIMATQAERLAANPEARIAAQNFVAGTGNERSDDLAARAKAGAGALIAGKVLGDAWGATGGKVISEASTREAANLTRQMLRNEATDVAATATAQKRFAGRARAAIEEVRGDKSLAEAIRAGEAQRAKGIAQSRLDSMEGARESYYAGLNQRKLLSVAEIDAQLARDIDHATGPKRDALVEMRRRFNDEQVPVWAREGKIVMRGAGSTGPTTGGKTQLPYVDNKAVRAWVTDAQNAASNTLGTIAETEHAKVKTALVDTAEDIWGKHLADVAKMDPGSKRLVSNLREYDRRASGLLAIKDVMKNRAERDARGALGLINQGKKGLDTAAMATAAATLPSHPLESMLGIGSYAAIRKGPAAARAINDRILVPLQRAAESGTPLAEAMVYASKFGIPAGLVRAAYAGAANPVDMAKSIGKTSVKAFSKTRDAIKEVRNEP